MIKRRIATYTAHGTKKRVVIERVQKESAPPKTTSELIIVDEGVRRAVEEYGEVLRKLANE